MRNSLDIVDHCYAVFLVELEVRVFEIKDRVTIHHGDCLEVMANMARAGIVVDAIVTDPPYELGFMGKSWDNSGIAFQKTTWERCLDVLKPGGHMLAFGGTRTYHRMTVAIEDAGFEIRDCLMWLYGSGFPKSLDVSKALTKVSLIDDAKTWSGWGTALKPAWEPCVLARKPLIGSVAENVLEHGCGGLNIDECRVSARGGSTAEGTTTEGRWPANVIHDSSDEVVEGFPDRKGATSVSRSGQPQATCYGDRGAQEKVASYNDSGSASRFFYCAKASEGDRAGSKHPTVKPIALMRYLCRLVTRKGGTILDPFAGSGTTLIAADREGFSVIGIEKDDQYFADCVRRFSGDILSAIA